MDFGAGEPGLYIRLLGPVRATVDGEPANLGGSRQRAVLAMLASRAGEPVSVSALIDGVWGEEPPESANAVQVTVTRLRRAIGNWGTALVNSPPGYRLDIDPANVDICRFEAAVGGLHERVGRRARLEEALSLWVGEPYADLDEVPFVQPERVRLGEMRIAALHERVELDLAAGLHVQLIAELEGLIRDHPYHEGLWRSLMLAQYRSGRQADALASFQRVRRLLGEELGLEPGPALLALEDAVLRQDPMLDSQRPTRRRLMVPATTLIGRGNELAALVDMVRSRRLVTLVGPGGVGKTRLAMEVAHQVLSDFEDEVWFVELADTRDHRLVIGEVARTLGVQGEDLVDAIAKSFDRPTLVVLDNFEQVIDAAADLARLLAATSDFHFLVTSRTPLHVTAEVLFPLSPLPTGEAVDLFITRAQDVRPAFSDVDSALRIADRLEGLPLAIELAAASLRILPTPDLIDRLGRRLAVQDRGARDLPARHRTIRNTLEWSSELLSDESRSLFAHLSVFASPFTFAAATAVCGNDEGVLEGLGELVDSSFLAVDGDSYRMLETVREFGQELLSAEGDTRVFQAKHGQWVLEYSRRARELLHSDREAETLADLGRILPDLRTAIDFFVGHSEHQTAAEILLATGNLWLDSTLILELARRLDEAASGSLEAETAAEVTAARGALAESFGDVERGVNLMKEAVERLRVLRPESVSLMNALSQLAAVAAEQGDAEAAFELADEAVAVSHRTGDNASVVMAIDNAGYVARTLGDLERALAAEQEAVRIARLIRSGNLAYALGGLAHTLDELGRYGEAARVAEEALTIADRAGSLRQTAAVLTDVGLILARSQPAIAARRLATAVADQVAMGMLPLALETASSLAAVVADDSPHEAAILVGAVAARSESAIDTPVSSKLVALLGREEFEQDKQSGSLLGPDGISRAAFAALRNIPDQVPS